MTPEQPIVLSTRSGQIHGTLLLPSGAARVPAVLIVSGSGPTDRDGNSPVFQGKNDSLKLLARALATAGFASVRFDKRGVAGSATALLREADLRVDDLVDDAVGWLDLLAADPRFKGVSIVGHSEGSLIGMLAAQRWPVRAFVSVAGAAAGAASVLRRQLHGKLSPELAQISDTVLSALGRGRAVSDVPPELASLYRPGVQPYLISWFKHNPADIFSRLSMPCTILQGDTDIQISVSEARALAVAKPDASLRIIEGMNHVLKLVPQSQAQQMASCGEPSLPLAPELIAQLVAFLRGASAETPVTLAPVAQDDLDALVAIRIEAMRDSLERIGRFDPVRARERFASGFSPAHTRHVVVGGERVGFIVVKPGADALLLDHLYVRPGSQARGIGAAVLALVFAEADARSLPLRVGALRGSASNRFYRRHGFLLVEQGEFDTYYLRPAAAASGS